MIRMTQKRSRASMQASIDDLESTLTASRIRNERERADVRLSRAIGVMLITANAAQDAWGGYVRQWACGDAGARERGLPSDSHTITAMVIEALDDLGYRIVPKE